MKDMKRITITKADLKPSSKLSDAGFAIFPIMEPDGTITEYPLLAHCSDECATEAEAIENIKSRLAPVFEEMPGDTIYSMNGEVKVWHGKSTLPDVPDKFVAYEVLVLPGIAAERVQQLLKQRKEEL